MFKPSLLAVSALALASAAQALPTTDPVFKPGQVWQMTFHDNKKAVIRSLTVGSLTKSERGMFFYEHKYQAENFQLADEFKYDPADSDPEYIQLTLNIYQSDPKQPMSFSTENMFEESCYVRLSHSKTQGLLSGFLIRKKGLSYNSADDNALKKYVTTGQRSGYPECWVKRIK